MPRISQPTLSSVNNTLFLYKYQTKRILARRQPCYQDALCSCRKNFPNIPTEYHITLHTNELDICEGQMTEIAEEMWEDVVGTLKSITVIAEPPEVGSASTSSLQTVARTNATPPIPVEASMATIRLTVASICGNQNETFDIWEHARFSELMEMYSIRMGYGPHALLEGYRLISRGMQLSLDDTPASRYMLDGDVIHLIYRLRGGKPVIYLLSPSLVEASVKLALAPQWDFSAIYPVVSIEKAVEQAHHREVTWRVQTQPNGDLKELITGLDVAYLFWEAHTNPGSAAPKVSNTGEGLIEAFNPNAAVLNDDNSVVLPVSKITPYLDRALYALGLHTEARTSFITYWLPSILKHDNIAFRFLPQASYEQAAPLIVSPTPDVVSRVFMVFQGVSDEEVSRWTKATAKVEEDVSFWEDVVGIDRKRTMDASLFRVVEWGGMEVLRPSSS
ncbi:hypothetical protein D9613_010306 [Agrocybe pediades]|uniref:Ubiquitin-like domain-containing protein n=1 Tax=Agrocybe pediades TaxID=84607 RepID=A0A8H4VHF4_9AGAR|nr:hypothetical protein D9613_010306 [Agrocybe pediades]